MKSAPKIVSRGWQLCSLARNQGAASTSNHESDTIDTRNNLSSTPKTVKNNENIKTVSDLDHTNNTSGSQYEFVEQNNGVILPVIIDLPNNVNTSGSQYEFVEQNNGDFLPVIDLPNNVEMTPVKGKRGDLFYDSDGVVNSDSDDSEFDPIAYEQDSDDSLIDSKISKAKRKKSKRKLSFSKPKNVKSKKIKLSITDAGSCSGSQTEASNLPNPPSLCTFDALSSSGSQSEASNLPNPPLLITSDAVSCSGSQSEASNVPEPHSVIDDVPNVSEEIITSREQNKAKKKERPKSDKKIRVRLRDKNSWFVESNKKKETLVSSFRGNIREKRV